MQRLARTLSERQAGESSSQPGGKSAESPRLARTLDKEGHTDSSRKDRRGRDKGQQVNGLHFVAAVT